MYFTYYTYGPIQQQNCCIGLLLPELGKLLFYRACSFGEFTQYLINKNLRGLFTPISTISKVQIIISLSKHDIILSHIILFCSMWRMNYLDLFRSQLKKMHL